MVRSALSVELVTGFACGGCFDCGEYAVDEGTAMVNYLVCRRTARRKFAESLDAMKKSGKGTSYCVHSLRWRPFFPLLPINSRTYTSVLN